MPMNPKLLRPRASGFSPKNITGLAAWYDASVASSVTLTSGFVSQWTDLSGGGLNLTQSVEADRPGTGNLNGKAAVSFDGANDYLANSATPSGWLFGTVLVAFSQDTTAASQLLVNLQVPSTTRRMSVLWSNLGEFRTQSLNASGTTTSRSGGSAATSTPRLLTYTFDGSTTAGLRLSAATLSGTTSTTGGSDAGLVIGARRSSSATSLPFDGLIGEVAIYSRVLSAVEIARVERYFAAKWGATLA